MAKSKQHQAGESPTAGTIEYLPLIALHGSPTNPRKSYPDTELKELANSIKEYGVINPITVRPYYEENKVVGYEVVSGHRRFMASGVAEQETIPCIVRDLSDEQVLDIQIAENLHRQDVPPLEEAAAFQMMLDTRKMDVDELAGKIGKSARYVYRRLKLNNLSEKYIPHVESGTLATSTAEVLASYPKEAQDAIYKKTFWDWNGEIRFDSHQRIKGMLESETCKELKKAIFPLDKENMQPGLVACNRCPKNTAVATLLFPDGEAKPQCTDKSCWKIKEQVHAALQIGEWEAYCKKNGVEAQYYDLYYHSSEEKKLIESVIGHEPKVLSTHSCKVLEDGETPPPGAFEVMLIGGSSWGDGPNRSYTRGWVVKEERRNIGPEYDPELKAIESDESLNDEDRAAAIENLWASRAEKKRKFEEMQFQKAWKSNVANAIFIEGPGKISTDFMRLYLLSIDHDSWQTRNRWAHWFEEYIPGWKPESFAKSLLEDESAEWNDVCQKEWDCIFNLDNNGISSVWRRISNKERIDFLLKIARQSTPEQVESIFVKIISEEFVDAEQRYHGSLAVIEDYEPLFKSIGKSLDEYKPDSQAVKEDTEDEFDDDWDANEDE